MFLRIKLFTAILFLFPIFIGAQELIKYDETNSPLIPNKLTSLAIDSTNTKWIGSDTTLYQFDNINWVPSLTSSKFFPDIAVSPNGTVFTITHSGYNISNILHFRNNHWENIEPNLGTMFNDPFSISIKNDTIIYFPLFNEWNNQVGYNTIGIYNNNDSINIKTPKVYFLTSIAPLNGDSLLMTDADGIHLFTGANWNLNEADWILRNPDWDSRFWDTKDWGYWTPIVKRVKNKICALGVNFFEYKNNSYLSYPEIDSVLFSDSLIATTFEIENSNVFWIGTNSGKLIKFSGSVQTFELTNSAIIDIALDKYGNKWFISNEGLFVFNENEIVSVENEIKPISNFELSQNYPNPFNPSTTITYSIPEVDAYYTSTTNVTLKVYDILGREVTTLINKEQKAGNDKVTFDAKNLTSGIYFYRLQSGNFSESRKMILLK